MKSDMSNPLQSTRGALRQRHRRALNLRASSTGGTRMEYAILVEDLVKRYGSNTVIKGISFAVPRGEIFALLGTNGAGKTTTLECIEGLRQYDSGNIKVNGRFGVQLQSTSLPGNILASEAYQLFYKWKKEPVRYDLFNAFELAQLKGRQYRELSTGQKRRLHLALALIGSPDIVFLDEPTAGLDVEGRSALHDQIRRLRGEGRTIIMASHDMAEVESLCQQIAILKDGKIAAKGSPAELTSYIGARRRILVKTERPLVGPDGPVPTETEQGYSVFIASDLGSSLLQILEACQRTANPVLDIRIEHATLEQTFLSIARDNSETVPGTKTELSSATADSVPGTKSEISLGREEA